MNDPMTDHIDPACPKCGNSRIDMTPVEMERMILWLHSNPRKSPELVFTAGPWRVLADHIVMTSGVISPAMEPLEELIVTAMDKAVLTVGHSLKADDRRKILNWFRKRVKLPE
jgi:hypothetical protein